MSVTMSVISAATAKRTLFEFGFELPGARLQQFATQLLLASQAEPETSEHDLLDRLLPTIEDGPTALVAENPELRCAPLEPSATTFEEAATAIVKLLGHELLDAYRDALL